MRWPFTGRDAELRLVGDTLAGGSAGLVIAGPAGVGKTRLATEAAELAAGRGSAVEWVRASRSARSIPLGAFAALLPATDRLPEGAELLARARHALAERAAGRRLVLCVDDAQLLDDASAALLHQLVAGGEAFAVVAVRRDDPVPDAVRALWKDELCALLELGELPRDEVDALLRAVLGGPVDGRSVTVLWDLTRGNALFLRELVRHGVDHGLLAQDGGIWRWHGALATGTRLTELVDLRVEEAGEDGRRLLELIAVGAPLGLGLLAPGERAALEALERAELVQRRTDGRRRFADAAHPLHAEAVRAQLAPTRAEALQTRLADAVEAHGARRGGDLLRVAVWRLESGAPGDAALLSQAAGQALAAPDLALAARLARAAVQAGGDFGSRLTLARALAGMGAADEAQRLLEQLEPQDDRQRAAVATASARNLFWALDRAEDAAVVLDEAERRVTDDALRHELTAQRVRLMAASGDPRAALATAAPLLRDDGVDDRARTTLALGAIESLFGSGQADAAFALAEETLPTAVRLRDELPHAEPVLLGMRAMALRFAGHLEEATALSESAYAALLPRWSPQGIAVEATSLGLIWLARGRVQTALRFCREGAALLRNADSVGMRAFALAGAAQAAGQSGDVAAAHDALAEMERTPLGHKGFATDLGLARAWTAAAGGELTRARDHAREAAEQALARGQDGYAVRALYDLCRLGEPHAGALGRLAGAVDGPFASIAAAHAEALAGGDGAALAGVAERLAAAGAMLAAAEAADAAATAFRAAGREASARAAAGRSAAWLMLCEGARPPTLLGAPEVAELTPREREIALLAAAGSSSRQIAGRLVISVRTVDNHLQSAYRKLGVSRREDLAGVLGAG